MQSKFNLRQIIFKKKRQETELHNMEPFPSGIGPSEGGHSGQGQNNQ